MRTICLIVVGSCFCMSGCGADKASIENASSAEGERVGESKDSIELGNEANGRSLISN